MSNRREFITTILAAGTALAACGRDGGDEPRALIASPPEPELPGSGPPATPAPAPATPATIPPTTASTTSSSTTTTSVPDDLPVPHPPPDPHADEPVVVAGTIEIPRIALQATMYEGVSLKVLDHGPGHWPGSAGPGQRGNMVIGGHRVTRPQPFRDLDRLEAGDEVVVGDGSTVATYRVTSTEIVTPDAMWIIEPTHTPTATLFACHPKGSTRQRIVVHLELDPDGGPPGDATT